ncbi:TusE/DsrC/DsvC family sulfur relay protein [Halotalea alkalilenta]|uniref:Sulfurtransferase n=1 Tax=Halotalea alkalilenta TaxID=376489 RepID=A0A172YGF1_9GAMM|nr:TusE/DsrC/DsvC family sulfur relay protein [Halotalea alkalilenta]ANF58132.1 sulfur relay protein TusE [Halotalea alkalilenta]
MSDIRSEGARLEIDGRSVALDPEGYLVELAQWTPEVAVALAAREGRELDARHWEILELLREFYARFELSPAMRPLIKAVRASLGDEKGSSLYLLALFPEGGAQESPARIAARLAGLPKPTNCH